jgi:beta-glucosidase
MCFQDAPAGVGDGVQRATAFPPGIQIAATWDRDLFFQRAVAIGEEFRGKGVHFALGPMMNIDRSARHGRNWEGFGADPYLSGENAFYYVQGLQDQGVVATAKHYICNEQETHRSSANSRNVDWSDATNAVAYSANLDDKTIHEIYLWPFASSVAAGVGSVMCSYNRVNGTPACQNKRTLNELLKEELEFPGNVMSDWGATRTGIESVLGGLDIDMPGGDGLMGMALLPAVQNGTISEGRIDDMITRVLAPYYLLGQNIEYPTLDLDRDTLGDHYKISRQISRAGIILLKNTNNVLPFNVTTDNAFAVYGEAASRSKHGFNDGGVLQLGGAIYQGGGSGYVEPTYAVDPLTSLLLKGRDSHLQIRYITDQLGYDVINASLTSPYLADAKCLVFISSFSTEGVDRIDLHAADNGDLLVKTVIVNSVSQLDLEAWIDHPHIQAVVWSGMPGSEYGPALVDVLFGDYNPGGKLVFTLAKHESDYGTDISLTENSNYREGVFLDYRHFDKNNIVPRYYFGYGLSYTTFSFAQLDISKTGESQHTASAQYRQRRKRSYAHLGTSRLYEPVYEITFMVTNMGKFYGSEVPQLYLGFPAEADEPPKVLRGFERVYLAAGESKQISLVLTQKDISYWHVINQKWTVARGTYTVWISTSANNADVKLQSSFNV